MKTTEAVAKMLWEELLKRAVGKKIEASLYPALSSAIPDKRIVVEEIVRYEQAEEVFNRFQHYLAAHEVAPILGTLGGNVVGIGYSAKNRGFVYYYDFDFGLFKLGTSLTTFMNDLVQ